MYRTRKAYKMRLDKFLANKALGSRREVHEIIKSKRVSIDGITIIKKDFNFDPQTSVVKVDEIVISTQLHYYIKLHKPAGYVTAVEDAIHPVVMDLLPPEYKTMGVFPVGRLDKDTEGLLLLTNDGVWGHRIINGKKDVYKNYSFSYEGDITPEGIELIKEGILLKDGLRCKPATLTINPENKTGHIEITEGKYHQVKRMIAAIGGQITYLKRESIGQIDLAEIEEKGSFTDLTQTEINFF